MDFSLAAIIGLVNMAGIVLVAVFNKLAHDKVVGNDLHHIAADVKTVMLKQDSTDDKLDKTNVRVTQLATDLSYFKGKVEGSLTRRTKSTKSKVIKQ